MMKMGWNGKVVDQQDVAVSVLDHGFLYGMGLFETFRTYHGHAFLLAEHLGRLQESCDQIGIQFRINQDETEQLIKELLNVNQISDAYIRYSVSAGEAELGLPSADYMNPNQYMYMKPLPIVENVKGKALQKLKLTRNTPEGPLRYKSFHFMNNILAKKELRSYPWCQDAEGLFFTSEGYAAEGIVSNLFFVKDKTCYTPSLDTGILPGITRSFVIKLAQELGFQIEQGMYTFEELLEADEIFMTNSIQELVPITHCYDEAGKTFVMGQGNPGLCTLEFLRKYRLFAGRGDRT